MSVDLKDDTTVKSVSVLESIRWLVRWFYRLSKGVHVVLAHIFNMSLGNLLDDELSEARSTSGRVGRDGGVPD